MNDVIQLTVAMVIRPLSKELQAKAAAELNEDPKRIEGDLKYLREWLSQQKHIRARTDDQWLITFLRGCKFSLEKTKEKLDMYYTMRTLVPEFFKDRDPFSPRIQQVLKTGILLPSKVPISPDSPKMTLFRNGIQDPLKVTNQDVFKTNLMILDILLMEDDQFVVCGMTGIQDMAGITMTHVTSSPLSIMKKAFTCFQDAYPIRPKDMHLYNIPSFFETIYAMIKPFMNEKMQKRLVVHPSAKIEEMYEFIPKRVLPSEYGGDAGPIQDLIDYWKKKVESYSEWFKEDEKKYGTDEALRPGKPKTTNELFGIEGSFRKLNVD
ncbi:hypothetical protein Trydic_g13435 [Trypoxylus dichotomus]